MTGRNPRRWATRTQLVIALIAAAAAFLVVVQARTERQTRRLLGVPSPQLAEIGYRLQREEQQRARLEGEIVDLRQRLTEFREAAGMSQRALKALGIEIRSYQILAGLTPVEGPGILVELSDNPRPVRSGENPNNLLLHYADLVRVVADFWAAGAEAIAINDERLIGTSGLSCIGTTILVNQRRMTPPFRIAVIGDPTSLVRDVGRRGTGLDMLKAFDFPVKVERRQRIEVPAYRGAIVSVIPN